MTIKEGLDYAQKKRLLGRPEESGEFRESFFIDIVVKILDSFEKPVRYTVFLDLLQKLVSGEFHPEIIVVESPINHILYANTLGTGDEVGASGSYENSDQGWTVDFYFYTIGGRRVLALYKTSGE